MEDDPAPFQIRLPPPDTTHRVRLLPAIGRIRSWRTFAKNSFDSISGGGWTQRERSHVHGVRMWNEHAVWSRLKRCVDARKVVNFCSSVKREEKTRIWDGDVRVDVRSCSRIRWTVKYWVLTRLHRTRYIPECKYADALDINALTRDRPRHCHRCGRKHGETRLAYSL